MNELMRNSLEAIALEWDLATVRAIEHIYEKIGSIPADAETEPDNVPQEPTLQALLRSIDCNERLCLNDAESIVSVQPPHLPASIVL